MHKPLAGNRLAQSLPCSDTLLTISKMEIRQLPEEEALEQSDFGIGTTLAASSYNIPVTRERLKSLVKEGAMLYVIDFGILAETLSGLQ